MSKVIGVMKCKDSSVPDFMVMMVHLVDDNEGYVGIKDDGEEYHVYCQYWDFEPVTECTLQNGVVFDAPIGMSINEFKCRQQSLNASDSDANINGIPLNKITYADVEVVKYDPTKVDGEQRVKCGELKIDGEWHESTINKYTRDCKGVQVDVYDVLQAFDVTNPALQHLIKKALCVGIRGHKTKQQDLQDIIDSAIRAKELEQ